MTEAIQLVCVSHRADIYDKYVGTNPHVDKALVTRYDNSVENVAIPVRYNHFIEHEMGDGWVVFMHHDLSFDEPLAPKLAGLPRDAIYGVCGAVMTDGRRFVFLGRNGRWRPTVRRGRTTDVRVRGQIKCLEKLSPPGFMGEYATDLPVVDTVDCCCVIVHSSLIRKHKLRFSPEFAWHFYSEDFSLNARREHGIATKVLQIECGHYGEGNLTPEFQQSKWMLVDKYGNRSFASTCYVPANSEAVEGLFKRRGIVVLY